MFKQKYQVRPLESIAKKSSSLKQPAFQENIKIFLKIKPHDLQDNHQAVRIVNHQEVEVIPPCYSTEPDRIYHYEQVFGPKDTNSQVFQKTMLEPISNVLSGFNSTIFIYGMTGAGKTHTMFNSPLSNDPGMVGSALSQLFDSIKSNSHNQYQVRLSFFEIYNQNIRDLLTQARQPLMIMQDAVRGVFINDLKERSVQSQSIAYRFIEEGMSRRVKEATKSNQFSSRSHAILQLNIRKITASEEAGQVSIQQSKLFMIDLAGNEKTSHNQNKRFVEGVNINKSLLTLGKCISILSEKKKNAFIPYRDSKLTRILKDSLGGNSKTVMIACISSEGRFYEETLNTLKYSSKAKQIRNKGEGGRITKMNISQLPFPLEERGKVTLNDEERVFQFINVMESTLADKIKTQKIQEELELCLLDLEKEKNSHLSKQIKSTVVQIKQKHASIILKMEEEIKKFVSFMGSLKESNPSTVPSNGDNKTQNKRREMMIRQQLQSSKSKTSSKDFPNFKTQSQKESKADTDTNLIPVCLSQEESHQSHNVSIHQKLSQKEPKQKKSGISIKIESCRNSNKENTPFNGLKRTSTSHSSLKSENTFSQKTFTKVLSNRPINDIKKEDYRVQSPSVKQHILIRCDSSVKDLPGKEQKGGDFFVNRLRNFDKNAESVDSEVLRAFLLEYEGGNYQLSRLEKSMLNKLKFVLKNRPKAMTSRPVSLGKEKVPTVTVL